MRFDALLLCAATLLVPQLEQAVADGEDLPSEEPIRLGVPKRVKGLLQFSTRCFLAPVPPGLKHVRVLASVVSLAGNPSLRGGWHYIVPGNEPDKDAGFETLDHNVTRQGDNYHLCIRTFSAQGCDFVLTAIVADGTADELPLITMRPSYPSIWAVTGIPLRLSMRAGLPEQRISAMPVEGEVKVEVFSDGLCGETERLDSAFTVRTLDGPDFIQLPESWKEFCIRTSGKGVVSLTAGPHSEGPLLAAAVPSVVSLSPNSDACEQVTMQVHEGVDSTITATTEDGSLLKLDAFLSSETVQKTKLANRWRGVAVPGGEGAVLTITGNEVASANKDAGRQGEAALKLNVCRTGTIPKEQPTLTWITAVTDSGVVTLSDGLTEGTVVRSRGNGTKASWRDFRFLVPGGSAKPKEITITASTSGKARLVADTSRFPNDAAAFRWSSELHSSEPIIRLTTDRSIRSEEVHLIDCHHFPCFIYISALAWTPGKLDAGVDTDLQVLVTSERMKPIPLVEGLEFRQRLAERESQVFSYRIINEEKPVLFTISTTEGTALVTACLTPDCKGFSKTRSAAAAIALTPSEEVFMGALEAAREHNSHPVIYLRVSSGRGPATFGLVGRIQGDPQILHNGDAARGAVEAGGYDSYKFFIGDQEVHDAALKHTLLEVTVQISPYMGDPDLFVSCSTDHPDADHFDWGGSRVGEDSIYFTSMSLKFHPGWVYIGIPGTRKAAYSIRVHWTGGAIDLQDGAEELGHVMHKDVRTYRLVVADRQVDDQPVALRANALVGAISMCVKDLSRDRRHQPHKPGLETCDYKASASTQNLELSPAAHLAALDIPASAVRKGGHFALTVEGLAPRNAFSLRAILDAPATLSEGRDVVDALAPICCVDGPIFTQLLKRSYVAFVRPVPHVTLTVKELGAAGNLAGALLMARPRGMKEGVRKWAYENHGEEKIEKFTHDPKLKLNMNLKDLSPNGRSFWLEIKVEAVRPVNFTMHMDTGSSAEVQSGALQLIPGQNLKAVATKDEETRYEFALDTKASDGTWHLRLRQCYGRMRFKLPYAHDDKWREGSDVDLPLPAPHERNSGFFADGSAAFRPLTGTPVLYELMLLEPGDENLTPIIPPTTSVLKQDPRSLNFVFAKADVNRSFLKEMIGPASDAELFYTLVAVPANDTMANVNSTCGLLEAMKRPGSLYVKLDQGKTLGQKQLNEKLPKVAGGEFVVNVVASLISDTGRTLASTCYMPVFFNASAPFGRAGIGPPAPNKMFMFLLLVGCVGCCWALSHSNGPCGSSKGPQKIKAVEMEDAYELHDSFDGTSLLAPRSGNYVPPSV